jgi:aerobic-type carbon monoxide dehydrogenase small subunit (CoxS/CutS family)
VSCAGVSIEINGAVFDREIEPRMLLSDFIRHEAHLTGTHVGCEHGVCGACTVQLEGAPVRSCLMFAVQAHRRRLRTVEALADADGTLHPLQQAFHETHALQCGFCTPGFLMAIEPMLAQVGELDDAGLRELISGNLCRCTGYDSIVSAVRLAHARMVESGALEPAAPDGAAAHAAADPAPITRPPDPAPTVPERPRPDPAPILPERPRSARRAAAAVTLVALAAALAAAIGRRRR